jgi:Xaa-Pro aminopeptidase
MRNHGQDQDGLPGARGFDACLPAPNPGTPRHACRRVLPVLALVVAAACGGGNPAAPTPTPVPSAFSEASFRDASRITAVAATDVLYSARPGQYERDIKVLIDADFQREGSGPPAFSHIVASGPNALDLHYPGDGRQLADGDLLLIDIGATSGQHCADLSRTLPVSGQFTARQRELYQLVLDAQRIAAGGARPGVDSLGAMDARVREFFRSSPLRAKDAGGTSVTMDRFFIHSLGHYVGRQVHGEDTGWKTNEPMRPQQVLTLEPGLYIPSEGIGIRIEDTYLVTTLGLECLSCACPKEIGQIERSGFR